MEHKPIYIINYWTDNGPGKTAVRPCDDRLIKVHFVKAAADGEALAYAHRWVKYAIGRDSNWAWDMHKGYAKNSGGKFIGSGARLGGQNGTG